MTRDDARALWASSGLDYAALTPENLRLLISLIDGKMKASGLFSGTFRMRRSLGLRVVDGKPIHAALRCKGEYFEDREAVSFNSDGFVGFAGWSDDRHVVPILSGFERWVSVLTAGGRRC